MDLIQILKALADENRMRILNVLKNGEMCVGEIEHVLDINQSNASRHLNKLGTLNLVSYEKKAQWVYYKINEEMLTDYKFLEELINNELKGIDIYNKDLEKLSEYRKSGITCETLKECDINSKSPCNCK